MPKPDAAHLQTDKELAKLEKRIAKIYKEAADDLQKTVDDYFAKFAKRDAKQKALLEAGEITEQEYKQWRLAQMGRGERFKALQSRVAERYTEANKTAVRYVNDATPGIYSLNRNYSAYTIEKVAGNVGFDLWDEQTVKRLIVDNPEVMPYYPPEKALNRGIDLAYGKRQISASVTSSILQGKSIPRIAKDLQTRMPEMNKASAVRTARTAVTGAQNAGRMDSYVAAEKMGIKVRKEWLATIDGRTRHSHAMLDGKVVDKDKKFENGCMFPGDPNGPAAEVYNCRCTLIAAVDGVDTSNAQRRVRNPQTGKNELVSDMTYSEWAGWKENKNNIVDTIKIKKPEFTPAKTIQEAEQFASQFVDTNVFGAMGVSYAGVGLDVANDINLALNDVFGILDIPKLGGITAPAKNTKLGKMVNAHAAYHSIRKSILMDRNKTKNAKAMLSGLMADKKAVSDVLSNPERYDFNKLSSRVLKVINASKETGRSIVAETIPEAITHELGHHIESILTSQDWEVIKSGMPKYATKISGYCVDSPSEYFAESFASYMKEENIIDPSVREIFDKMRRAR